jgi:hypothetical protein
MNAMSKTGLRFSVINNGNESTIIFGCMPGIRPKKMPKAIPSAVKKRSSKNII